MSTSVAPRATHSVRGIDLMGYKNINSYCTAKWCKADPERRRKQQLLYYKKNAEAIKRKRRERYRRLKAERNRHLKAIERDNP